MLVKKILILVFAFIFLLFLQNALAQNSFCAKDPYTYQWKCWGSGYKCNDYWSPVVCGGNKINLTGSFNISRPFNKFFAHADLIATAKYENQEFSSKVQTDSQGHFYVEIDVPYYMREKNFYLTFYLKGDYEDVNCKINCGKKPIEAMRETLCVYNSVTKSHYCS